MIVAVILFALRLRQFISRFAANPATYRAICRLIVFMNLRISDDLTRMINVRFST